MYKSLFIAAVVLYDGVAAQNTDVGGIKYRCVDSTPPYDGRDCQIEVTQNFNKTSLTWQTLVDGSADLDWFDFGSFVIFSVVNCDNLQEIDFSDAPPGQVISYPSGSGGLVMERLPNLHTIKLGGVTEVGWLLWNNIGTSLDHGVALNFEAPQLHTVRDRLSIENLAINELRFNALRVVGNLRIVESRIDELWFPNLRNGGSIGNVDIDHSNSVRVIFGLFDFDELFAFDPYLFWRYELQGAYDGLRIINMQVYDIIFENFKFN